MGFAQRFITIALILSYLSAHAEQSPKTFDNQYKTKLLGFNILVTSKLSKVEGNNYQLLFRFNSMLGYITETSEIRWDAKQATVVPQHYVYKRRGLGKNRDADLKFDWSKKTVVNNVEKTSWTMDIKQKVQDKLSYQLQLQQDLIRNQENPSYQIADGGRLKDYQFFKIGEEILDTPLGKVNTIKVERSRKYDKRKTYMWLAKDWGYLLVRLQQEEKGEAYTLDITKASLDGQPIEHF